MTLLPFHRRRKNQDPPLPVVPCCWVATRDPAGGVMCRAHAAAVGRVATEQARTSYSRGAA